MYLPRTLGTGVGESTRHREDLRVSCGASEPSWVSVGPRTVHNVADHYFAPALAALGFACFSQARSAPFTRDEQRGARRALNEGV